MGKPLHRQNKIYGPTRFFEKLFLPAMYCSLCIFQKLCELRSKCAIILGTLHSERIRDMGQNALPRSLRVVAALVICGTASHSATANNLLSLNGEDNKEAAEKSDYQTYLNEATLPQATYSARKKALLKALTLSAEGSPGRLAAIYASLTFLNAATAQDTDFPSKVSLSNQALKIAEQVWPIDVSAGWLRLAAYQAENGDVDSAVFSARQGFKKLNTSSKLNDYGLLPPFGLTYLLYKNAAKAQAKELMNEAIATTVQVYGEKSPQANLQRTNKFEMLVRHREYKEARPALLEALENINFTLPDMRRFLTEAPLPDLQRIYFWAIESVRDHDSTFAEFVIKTVIAKGMQKLSPEQSPAYVRNGMRALAHCYYKAGLYGKSYETYSRSFAFEKSHHLQDLTSGSVEEVRDVYKRAGKKPEGEYAEEQTVLVDGLDQD